MFIKNWLRLFSSLKKEKFSTMNVFIQKLNPITGANDWIVQNEDYDYHQEVARSAFADMLHDTERNQLYEQAIKAAIEKMHAVGKRANVLDIGTGTGLLSMMAAKHGADSIVACEAFKPMGECALKIIAINGFQDKIKVIPKRSTQLTVGDGGDIKERCNILVTEVFDTELIGEGALSTFNHAHKNLLEKDSIVVPTSATIYAQIVECPLAQNWNKIKDIFNDDGELLIRVPDSINNCLGSAAVHDIQLSQLPQSSFNTIISPLPVLRFDWSGKTPFIFERSTINTIKSEADGKAQVVFMWWDLQMDIEGKLILSCAPHWAHPLTKKKKNGVEIPWRDHWMQAVYYLPQEIIVKKDQEIHLISCHDEYSLWFNLTENLKITDVHYLNPVCECGLHVTFSRTRIGQMNDTRQRKKFLSLFDKHVNSNSVIIILSDGFYFGLTAAKLGAKKIYFTETNHMSRRILHDFINHNNLENVEVMSSLNQLKEIDFTEVTMILGEPYFISSILPWDNLLFVYLLKGMRKFLSNTVQIFPVKAVIKGIAVHFEHLWKIRSPLKTCEGFLMKHFDDLIEDSSNISDDNVEAQPLWEYPGIALTKETEIVSLDLVNVPETALKVNGSFFLHGNLDCNGIALWVEWHLDGTPKNIISTGPVSAVEVGQKINWDMYTRQGVWLFPSKAVKNIDYTFKFDFNEGSISFTSH
ncbi:hypothetical protein NQ318_020897 [Aromia moschata]|uniref:Protein arginine N-methyltransferase n=1 Tax=Aromia moschata TaxID=1265417 RepID=A0AAV8XZW8_9CUCU|nr:hypothetical protein NQ318_020897 [Aromia moschata]